MSIFDLMTSQELASYWNELEPDRPPYPFEQKFEVKKKRGLDISWLKGSKGLPVVLNTSNYDTKAIPRGRIGFERLQTQMPFFKESKYIDEELRQELNMVIETGNQAYIDAAMERVFDDTTELLEAAAASRERMRAMAATTGMVAMASNGQQFEYDYGIPTANKKKVSVSWSDHVNSDPIEDMRLLRDHIQDETGETVTEAMCDGKTWRHIRNNEKIKKDIYVLAEAADMRGPVKDSRLREYILDELGLVVEINDKRYKDENGNATKFMPEDTFCMWPDGYLGNFWFGTTPEESDLMSLAASNVTIVDTGVAITTMTIEDPVNVETKVTMICLPDLPQADKIGIIDTVA